MSTSSLDNLFNLSITSGSLAGGTSAGAAGRGLDGASVDSFEQYLQDHRAESSAPAASPPAVSAKPSRDEEERARDRRDDQDQGSNATANGAATAAAAPPPVADSPPKNDAAGESESPTPAKTQETKASSKATKPASRGQHNSPTDTEASPDAGQTLATTKEVADGTGAKPDGLVAADTAKAKATGEGTGKVSAETQLDAGALSKATVVTPTVSPQTEGSGGTTVAAQNGSSPTDSKESNANPLLGKGLEPTATKAGATERVDSTEVKVDAETGAASEAITATTLGQHAKEAAATSPSVATAKPTGKPLTAKTNEAEGDPTTETAGEKSQAATKPVRRPVGKVPANERPGAATASAADDEEKFAASKAETTVVGATPGLGAAIPAPTTDGAAPSSSSAAPSALAAANVPPNYTNPATPSPVNQRFSQPLLAPRAEAGGNAPRTLTEAEQSRFVQRVSKAFEAAEQRGGGEMRLRLSPPELGSLRMEIKLQGGQMSARLEAETPAAQKLLTDHLPALKERLAEYKINIDKFDVELMDRQPNGGSGGATGQQGGGQNAPPRTVPEFGRPSSTSVVPANTVSPRSGGDGRLNVIV